jgi:hypothetical protein
MKPLTPNGFPQGSKIEDSIRVSQAKEAGMKIRKEDTS